MLTRMVKKMKQITNQTFASTWYEKSMQLKQLIELISQSVCLHSFHFRCVLFKCFKICLTKEVPRRKASSWSLSNGYVLVPVWKLAKLQEYMSIISLRKVSAAVLNVLNTADDAIVRSVKDNTLLL